MGKLFWYAAQWPIALFFALLTWAIKSTSRVTTSGAQPDGAAVYVNWHRYQSYLIPYHGSRRRWMLVSPVPQLEPIARFCKLMGLRLVRGASGERGKEAREELKQLLVHGESVVLAVDGPHGPAFRAKRGCVDLARSAGVPIVPACYRCSSAHQFRWRWDSTLMPLPFGRIEIIFGAPISPSGSDEEMLVAVENALNAIDVSR